MSISDAKRPYAHTVLGRYALHDTATSLLYDLDRTRDRTDERRSTQRPCRSDEQSSPPVGSADFQEAWNVQRLSGAGGDAAGRGARHGERVLELGRQQDRHDG